ncbi:2-hydroxyacyl-CoA lyase 2-like isoform X2 [Stegodyphus dumicola]|uniref:2-hydroxyacyl-CoA lyase 2-like isoform X2 n=1 Tax=Stegodyphus dumicola TaxID=202533 RepID=UPI0015AFEFA4|nr:2-hydroxyacyl-CoA lyase 2-like isoform X2 [Stegodyphus dumicola]
MIIKMFVNTPVRFIWKLNNFRIVRYSQFFTSFPKIDPNSKDHGGNLVAEVLKSHNVTHLFTLIGGHISPLIVASEKLGIRVIDTRQEVTAVFAADAFARISGTIGVAAVTAGPGVTNTITAVKNAQMAETPLLLLGGAAASLLKGRGALQDIDQLSLLKSICKYTKTVTCVRHLVPVLQKAIQIAYSGTPGPVFVELPLDILYPYQLVKQEMKIKENPKGILQNVTTMYLKAFLHYQFASGFIERNTSPLPVHFPLASNHQVQKAQELLSKSKRPLFLLGSQALIPPTSAKRLKQALEALNIPCFLGGMSRGLLGRQNPLHIRQKRREALQEADLVLLAGTVCDFRLSYGRVINPKSKVIAVNMDKKQLYKNSGIFWNPTIAFQANVPDFISRLSESVSQNKFEKDWLSRLQERDNATEKSYREKVRNSESDFLDPVHLLYELESALPENTVLVADGGDFVSTAAYIIRPRGALKWLDPGAFGTLGVGAGFAIGAKLCYPDCNVVILYGDGSLGYSLIEFDTFIRHKIPVVAVVGNDACWTQIAREQVPRFGSDIACNLTYNDYHKIVEALGGKGIYLSGKDKDDLVSKFKHAIELSSSGNSVLVNATIGKTDFRSGSISI